MRKRRIFVWVRHTLFIAAVSILPLQASAPDAGATRADLSAAALKEVTPEGYKVEKTIACDPVQGAQQEHIVALSDADDHEIHGRPVMLLLVAVGKKIVVEDSVTPHNAASTNAFWDGPPNYFSGMTRENVGGSGLFLVKSVLSGGGSGSLHFFHFYKAEKKKLRLVKSFVHERMQETYFAVYKNAIYDAELVCAKGERHGRAFVYTCYLQVTKYTFDGQAIGPVGSERMREQRGNRYLEDKYRFVSLLKALQNNEIFTQAP